MKEIGMTAKFALFAGAATIGLTGFGKIVHTPRAAIASGSNPSVVEGATWSFHRRIWWNDPNPATSAFVFKNNRTDGLAGFQKASDKSWDFVPCVLVNPTSSPISSADIMGSGGIAIDPIEPGELAMHPGVQSSADPNRAVLRFEVPRDGLYSLSAVFRALNCQEWVSKVIDVSVMLDGVLLYQVELAHPDNVTRKTYAFDKMYLTAGQAIEIAVGSGLTESTGTQTPSHQGDAVGIKLTIVEEDEATDPIADSWDLSTGFVTDTKWTFYEATASSLFFEYSSPKALAKTAQDGVLPNSTRISLNGGAKETEHVTVYNPDATTSALAGLGTYVPTGYSDLYKYPDRIAPGELSMHPDYGDKEVIVRFLVPEDGRYVADYALRDISLASDAARADNGVSMSVLAGSVCLGQSPDISIEHGSPIDFRQFVTPPLKAGTAVDFVFQNRGQYASDGTAGRIRVLQLADTAAVADGCAATALRANALGANANPFVDASGATWTMAKSSSPTGEGFVTLSGNATSAKFVSKTYTASDSLYAKYGLPVLRVNTTLESVDNAADANVAKGQVLYPNEFWLHPSSHATTKAPFYTVLRYTAPARGVYAFRVTARDVDAAASTDGNAKAGKCGVEVYVARTDGTYLAKGYANADANDAKCWAQLAPNRVYLEAGESVDMSVGPKAGRQTSCDATAVYENVQVAAVPDESMVAVDIRTIGATGRYVARGRVGWANQSWTRTQVENGVLTAKRMRDAEGPTRTAFTLARADGTAATSAALGANTLMDDGVVSTNATDVYAFELTGLVPNADYTLYLYGSAVSGGTAPAFVVGGVSASPSLAWSRPDVADVAVVSVKSDAAGAVQGTFRASGNGGAAFCGLQVAGGSFKPYRGLMLLVR